jgi:hypothetical protein
LSRRSYRIAVAGTHSTGKTTFLEMLRREFERRGEVVAYVHESALNARKLGFPILADHTFESTVWLIARAMELEAVATLEADVILVDRPVLDAIGYLLAALEHTGRVIGPDRLERLEAICAAWAPEYDLVFLTLLNPFVSVGEGRDGDPCFRLRAADAVAAVVNRHIPSRHLLPFGGAAEALSIALRSFESSRDRS